MKCPLCGYADTKVLDSRNSIRDNVVKRRRECIKCGSRFTTRERTDYIPFYVVYKDGSCAEYEKNILLQSMVTVCEGRAVSLETLQNIVDEIDNKIIELEHSKIYSELIGEMVLKRLAKIDVIAFIKYAVKFKNIENVDMLFDELKEYKEINNKNEK